VNVASLSALRPTVRQSHYNSSNTAVIALARSAAVERRRLIEHVAKARLVVADLSFHNPDVFYELALWHATGERTVNSSARKTEFHSTSTSFGRFVSTRRSSTPSCRRSRRRRLRSRRRHVGRSTTRGRQRGRWSSLTPIALSALSEKTAWVGGGPRSRSVRRRRPAPRTWELHNRLHTWCTLERMQNERRRKAWFAGPLQSPLTDSNRRPPPYHGTS
jgi:hypothetical protein